jgi:EAL domain-containing protein (putative c-di-GMP-specific phosphodiesterase class I)
MRIDVMIGISAFPGQARDAEQLFYQTSIARHSLRQQGTGGVKLFDLALDVGIQQRQRLRRSLHSALEADELSLVFQPIEPCGYPVARKMEALLRWDEPELGAISPLLFIPVAEESGLIVPLGRWVLLSACKAAVQWSGDTVVSVNVSIHQILGGDLLADVKAALAGSGLAAERLEIEITESVFSHDIDLVCSVLQQIRALGVSLALDDFGTGYSSLAYLRKLPVNILKIDRSFIADLDHEARKLLLAIVGMARGLGFRIVVEGVETEQQRNLLVAMGVDYLQGYLISRPIAAGKVSQWLSVPNLLSP